jgi:hypothetical protein
MKEYDKDYVLHYIMEETNKQQQVKKITSKHFIYDYNEVQELFFAKENYQVYLAGPTGLHKTDMLKRILANLIASGIETHRIMYLDYNFPFVRKIPFEEILVLFVENKKINQLFYLIINEVEMIPDWQRKLEEIHKHYKFIKVLCSCSISYMVHEYFLDHPNDYSKIVVLSSSNKFNVKYSTDTFGVYNDLKYNIKKGVCEIKGMTREGKEKKYHIIPKEINGYPVKIIANGAFHHRDKLLGIELPDSIEYIGDYAFTQCECLKSIRLPANLKYIGECTFLGATNLAIIIGGNKVSHIGNSAFYGTHWLKYYSDDFVSIGRVLYKYKGYDTTIMIPNLISIIGYYAFANTEVETIDIFGIKKIEEGAFFNCKNLRFVHNFKPNKIEAFQFYNCRSLTPINKTFNTIKSFAFCHCLGLKHIKFEGTRIDNNAFEGSNIIHIMRENQNKDRKIEIGHCAFWYTPLQSIDMDNVCHIGKFAFSHTQLCTISLENAKKIEDCAFSHITSLQNISIRDKAVLGRTIFLGSNNIQKARLSVNYILNSYFGEESRIEELILSGENCVDNICRQNQYLRCLEIYCKKIGDWAFYQNSNLSFVKLKIEEFGYWCFADCNRLEEIDIPPTVKFIEMNTFRYCRNLRKITIRNNKFPVLFGINAFYSTSGDKQFFVNFPEEYVHILLWQEYIANIEQLSTS